MLGLDESGFSRRQSRQALWRTWVPIRSNVETVPLAWIQNMCRARRVGDEFVTLPDVEYETKSQPPFQNAQHRPLAPRTPDVDLQPQVGSM